MILLCDWILASFLDYKINTNSAENKLACDHNIIHFIVIDLKKES